MGGMSTRCFSSLTSYFLIEYGFSPGRNLGADVTLLYQIFNTDVNDGVRDWLGWTRQFGPYAIGWDRPDSLGLTGLE